MVLLAGGHWDSSSRCGSRCRAAATSISYSSVGPGARGRSLPKKSFLLGSKKFSVFLPQKAEPVKLANSRHRLC